MLWSGLAVYNYACIFFKRNSLNVCKADSSLLFLIVRTDFIVIVVLMRDLVLFPNFGKLCGGQGVVSFNTIKSLIEVLLFCVPVLRKNKQNSNKNCLSKPL